MTTYTHSQLPLSISAPSTQPDKQSFSLGRALHIEISTGSSRYVDFFRRGVFVRRVDRRDKVAFKLFVLELVDLGANQSALAEALSISRQTIHNYREIRTNFGVEGLVQGYSLADGDSREAARSVNRAKLPTGNKARQVAEIRQKTRETEQAEQHTEELSLNFSFNQDSPAMAMEPAAQPYMQTHEWEPSRYAGQMSYLVVLFSLWRWEELVIGHFGEDWPIFHLFVLMAGQNIRSMEQLKHVRSREAGVLLGFESVPSRPKVAAWFYGAAAQGKSTELLSDYFRYQLRAGLVGVYLWFTDGHLLPYTGSGKVHHAYNTQRQNVEPGQTNLVTCDEQGRIVDFVIEEGKGDLKERVVGVTDKWEKELPVVPVSVFDREGYGAPNFSRLVKAGKPFITWDKNLDTAKLAAIEDERFSKHFEFNNKHYAVFESQRHYCYTPEEGDKESEGCQPHEFTLRHLFIWNQSTNRRTCAMAYAAGQSLSLQDCVRAVLTRWGASENTFKHLQERHPYHYHPGFALVDSERQEIANPELKQKDREIGNLRKKLDGTYKRLAKTEQTHNRDGKVRRNSAREKLQATQIELEVELQELLEEKKQLPERVDVTNLENYRSFKRVDNEGKNLFDFATTSVWNARKKMVEWLRGMYEEQGEVVDLFYAIADCHGWVRSTPEKVIVRLEPLQQPRRRAAQEHLCRRLSSLCAQTPSGKWLSIEVGGDPSTA